MKEFTLPKAGGTARIDLLDGSDLADVLALQEKTRAALPHNMKMFVLPQPTSYFQNFLMRQNGLMIGIRAGGVLVAQMALMGPLVLREAIAAHVITFNQLPFHHAGLDDSVVVCKSVAVHPEWRGNDLANNLLGFACAMPFALVADHLFAQVSVGNKRSWDVFARQGFGIVAAAYDINDGQPRFVFQKPAIAFDFADEIIADEVDPAGDFSAIVTLTQRDGLIGVYEQGSTDKLAFLRSRDALNLMPTLARVQSGD